MPTSLDFPTLSLATSALVLALAGSMLYVRATRRTYPGFDHWVAGALFAGLASLLGVLRGELPSAASAVIGNTLASLGIALVASGLERFLARPGRSWPQLLGVGATLATSLAFTWWWPSLRARVATGEAIYLVQVSHCLWLVVRGIAPALGGRNRLLELVLGLQAGWGALRVVMVTLGDGSSGPLLDGDFARNLTFLLYPTTTAVLTFGLTVLDLQRVEADLRASVEEVRTLRGIIPICATCKKVREGADWTRIDAYVQQHTEAQFSHGICPECLDQLYPGAL